MKSRFKKQLWISIGVICIAVIAASVAMYYFSDSMTTQAATILADKNLLARQTTVLGVLADLKSQAPQAAQYTTAMNALVPTHDSLIGFSDWVTKLGLRDNVSVSVSFNGQNVPASGSSLGTDGFAMTVVGASADTSTFFTDFEKAQNFLVSISGFDFANSGPGYRITLQGKVFSRST